LRRKRWTGDVGASPVDRLLDEAQATVSLGARRLCCRLNADANSFARAAENLLAATGVRLSPELLRRTVEGEGERALECCAKGELACPRRTGDPPAAGDRLYLGCDGFHVGLVTESEKKKRRADVRRKRRHLPAKPRPLPARRRRGADGPYKEFKLVTFYDQARSRRLVSVTRRDHRGAGRLMRRDAARCGYFEADQRLAVIDGGPWIVNQIRAQSLPVTAVCLDFYHLAENVHKARRTCFGEEDPDGTAWAAETLHVARHGGYEPLRDRLVTWRATLRSPAKRRAAGLLTNYVTDRREMLDYPRFVKEGWQIGSGPTESQCKQVPRRVKGRGGKRWDADHAEAVMALECLEQSRLSDVYWENCFKNRN
jgi:hypothetical protein